MERVTRENIDLFYKGSIIFRINPFNGKELGYKYITNDNNDIIVRQSNVLLDFDCGDRITSLQENEIIKDHFYFYKDEVGVLDTKIEWLKKEIKRKEELKKYYLEMKDNDFNNLEGCTCGVK